MAFYQKSKLNMVFVGIFNTIGITL